MAKFSAIIFLYIRYLTFINFCANTTYKMCRTLSQAVGTQRAMSWHRANHCNKETLQS
jgi:hypothetical protein